MATTYLSRTPSSAGNRAVWTWSAWIKINGLNGNEALFNAGGWSAGQDGTGIVLYNGSIYTYWNSPSNPTTTSQLFRDSSAWYHVVLQANTSTLKVYINGSEVSSKSISGNGAINNTTANTIGRYSDNAGGFFNGYMSEVHFTDGTAYAASTFGETDTTGVWVPKVGPTVTYGTNGFYLKFANSGAMGTDSSGQSNTFALGGGTLRQVTDSPTNVFATLNPNDNYYANSTFSEGNCKMVTAASGYGYPGSTIGLSTGKWYFEAKASDLSGNLFVGIASTTGTGAEQELGYSANDYGYKFTSGAIRTAGSETSYGNSISTSDILGVAIDLDNNKLYFSKNGTFQNSGNPVTGSNGFSITAPSSTVLGNYFPTGSDINSSNSSTVEFNFGNPTFTIASGNADGNGKGNFEYAPPTGYLAICTDNLSSELTIPVNKGADNFNTITYTGTGSTQSMTGVGFQPDFVWLKSRSNSYYHNLYDSVRGATRAMFSNYDGAEVIEAGNLQSFISDGFTAGGFAGTNGSGSTYVAWNWKAGSTTPANTYAVKVVSDSGNKYRFDDYGTSAVTLELQEGGTFTFDQSDSSNAGHPLRFSSTADGTHGGGSEYTTGVTTTGTPGQAGAKTVITVAGSAPTLYYYCSVHSGMGGQANTGSLFGFTNVKGALQSVVSPNTTAGFSIVSYTGTGSNTTIGHGLSATPTMMLIKNRTDGSTYWIIYHKYIYDNVGSTYFYVYPLESASLNNATVFNSTAPTSSVFSVGTNGGTNASSKNYVAYCFNDIEGYQKAFSYTGNGSTDGTFCYLGFRPAMIILMRSDSARNPIMLDNKRNTYNAVNNYLHPNLNSSETGDHDVDFLSNGIKIRNSNATYNASNGKYFGIAFAENPFVTSTGKPVTAR